MMFCMTKQTHDLMADLSAHDVLVDQSMKAFAPEHEGSTISELAEAGLSINDLALPLVTLSAAAMESNLNLMHSWVDEHGIEIQPHGKTTMAPALWRAQIRQGATGITVATPWQLRIAAAAGITSIQHAGAMVDASSLENVGRLAEANSDLDITVWADSVRTVSLMASGYPDGGRPLGVLVERGAIGSRTGARTNESALDVARAIADSPNLQLRGVAAWEGSLPDPRPGLTAGDAVGEFCDDIIQTFVAIESEALFVADRIPMITAGGSAHFDIVAKKFAFLTSGSAPRARVVLRSGCYLTHDDGYYARKSPLAAANGQSLKGALHGWAQVVSRPEEGLVVLNIGRRDVSFDQGLPVLLGVRGADSLSSRKAIDGAVMIGLDDQHARVTVAPESSLAIGDVVQLGISHPCTTFDKWGVIPVVDDAHSSEPQVVAAVRTIF